MTSLRRQLLFALLAAVVIGVALAGFAVYRTTRDEIDHLFDYHLRQVALSLRDRAFGTTSAPPPVLAPGEDMDVVIQVWSADGVVLYLSQPHRVLPAQVQLGFADVRTSDGEWRVFGLPLANQVVQVAQPMRVRRELALAAAWRTTLPFVLLLPALGLTIWVVVGRSLRPLDALARSVSGRRPGTLAPLRVADAPEEVLPLVRALNDLLERLDRALQAQRAFVADAAHALRTPLTALQLQSQLLFRARDAQAREAAVAELARGLERMSRLVAQLLTLARLEPGIAEGSGSDVAASSRSDVPLADLAREVVADLATIAREKGIDLGVDAVDEDARVVGDRDALHAMLTNLVENAVRYTQPGGRVDVATGVGVGTGDRGAAGGTDVAGVPGATGGRPCLRVSDTGPGIPEDERAHVFDRFRRGAQPEQTGTGLGLAIAKAVADRHGARIVLGEREGGGLVVTVEFPARGDTGVPTSDPAGGLRDSSASGAHASSPLRPPGGPPRTLSES